MSVRFLFYTDHRRVNVIEDELSRIDPKAAATVLNKLKRATEVGLTPNFYKVFKGYRGVEFGEFLIGDYRILSCKLSSDTFLLLRLFKKTTNATPEAEKTKALNRYFAYLRNTDNA